ncbi:MAG: sn-glycerol-3-phosphate ABC transporter substrate-binding protein UgpB [Acetobacteraceae bacterium]|nr:sn-glycerol-3-phosphate ABC transporter substrate-binding protein UgpB [Acetobacteraceae bacterium]
MKRREVIAASAGLAVSGLFGTRSSAQSARTPIVWWHAMTAANAEQVNRVAADFNASQDRAEITAVYKGTYPDLLNATIAAFRAGQAPHVAQIFEVGTGSMLAAGKAVKQNWQLAQEAGVTIDPAQFVPAVRGYYSLPDGRLASMPFNSSTAVMWYNKDAFAAAGLDPEQPPATWPGLVSACAQLKAKNAIEVPMMTSWPSWIQFEQYSAIHDLPFATEADGFNGLGAELVFNSPAHARHLQRLMDMSRDGTFRYGGRGDAPENLFPAGTAAIMFESSGNRGLYSRTSKFRWGEAMLPFDPAVIAAPNNAIIGGASLWAMTAPNRTAEEYRAVGALMAFIAEPDQVALWHQKTGYIPTTEAGYELSRQQGWYEQNPGADIPIRQLTRGHVTDNSRGLRLGRLPEIRTILEEEIERALQGEQTAQAALDRAVERGNKVLRDFQRSVRA